MMTGFYPTLADQDPVFARGVTECLVAYVRRNGPIISLDAWAHEIGYDPRHVRACAHQAARESLLKLTRLEGTPGRPYRVELLEEKP